MAKVIVSGGCGYIGSHTIIDLLNHNFDVIAVDSNIRSDASILKRVEAICGKEVPHAKIDLCDAEATAQLFEEHQDAVGVIHFAALKSVPESVEKPNWYYQNNLNSLLNVLNEVEKHQIPNFIFSSSCSVYGNAEELPVVETTPLGLAESPYASTKQMGERILQDFYQAQPNLKTILLRYFNPGGAHPSAKIGEIPQPGASNVIPILMETVLGKRKEFAVFGGDYPTRDGTCIRDYIHVMDLANAHTKCLEYLMADREAENCEVFNVGIGEGVTVLEAIKATEKATGKALNYRIADRRAGDVIAIYANYEKAAKRLGWYPQYNIDDIMATAWAWEQARIAEMES
jgi:UDP-glucose 4-epimerase